MLAVGDEVPDFSLALATPDGKRTVASFHEVRNGQAAVIAFYPLAFTGVCTTEMCELRDRHGDLARLSAQTFGFSVDAAPTNVAFIQAHNLDYPVWSDPNREIVDTLWETMTVIGVHRVAKRGFLIITKDGIVAEKWITDDADLWLGVEAIEAALAKLA